MKIREIYNYILGRKSSSNIARQRLHLVLMHDRAAASSRVSLKPGDGAATLEAVFMVKSLKRGRERA